MVFKLLLVVAFLSSCTKTITNSLDRAVYKCGESARNEQSLVEVLGPEGSPLSTVEGLEALLVSTDGQSIPLKVTEKGCIALPGRDLPPNAQLVVRQKTKDINLGRILTDGPVEASLSLAKVSSELKPTECKEPIFQSRDLVIPSQFQSWIASRFLWKGKVGQREEQVLVRDGADATPAFFAFDAKDLKEKIAAFTVTDLLTGDISSLSCPLIVDQKDPTVAISLARDPKYPFMRVDSNAPIEISALDDSPADVYYCFAPQGVATQCEFRKVTSSIKTPESGYWELHTYAIDAAGNRSPTTTFPLISWGKDAIENLRLIARSSLASGSDIEALRLALTARKIWQDLKTSEEKAEVKDLVEYVLLKAVNTRKERYRRNVNDLEDTVASAISSPMFFKVARSGTVSAWNFIEGTSFETSMGELPPYGDLMVRASRNGASFVAGSSYKLKVFNSHLSQSHDITMPLGSKAVLIQPHGEASFDLIVSSGERYKVEIHDGKLSQDALPATHLNLNSAALTESGDLVVADSDELIHVISGKEPSKKLTFPHGVSTSRFSSFNTPIKRLGLLQDGKVLFSLSTHNELKLFGPLAFEGAIPEIVAYKLEDDLKDGIFVSDRLFVAIYPQKIVTYDVYDRTQSPYVLPIQTPVLAYDLKSDRLRVVTDNRIFDLNPRTREVGIIMERGEAKTYAVAMSGSLIFLDQIVRQQSPSRLIAGYDLAAMDASRIEMGAAVPLAEAGLIAGCHQNMLALADARTLKVSSHNVPCDPAVFDAKAGKTSLFVLTPRGAAASSPDDAGETLFGGDEDLLVVRKLDLKGRLIGMLSHPDDGSAVTALQTLADLGLTLTGSDDQQLRVYEDSSLEPRDIIPTSVGRIVALHRHQDLVVIVGDRGVEIRRTLSADEEPLASLGLDGEPLASAINAAGTLLLGGDQFSGLIPLDSSPLKVDLRPLRYRVSAVALDANGRYALGLENGGIQKGASGEGAAALSLHESEVTAAGYSGAFLLTASENEVKIGLENEFHTLSYLSGAKRFFQTADGSLIPGASQLQHITVRMDLLQSTGCEWLTKADRPGICL